MLNLLNRPLLIFSVQALSLSLLKSGRCGFDQLEKKSPVIKTTLNMNWVRNQAPELFN